MGLVADPQVDVARDGDRDRHAGDCSASELTQDRCGGVGARRVSGQDCSINRISLPSTSCSAIAHAVCCRWDLAQMKPSAYLVNTSRGPIVDEAALIDALQTTGSLAQASTVFDVEPLR